MEFINYLTSKAPWSRLNRSISANALGDANYSHLNFIEDLDEVLSEFQNEWGNNSFLNSEDVYYLSTLLAKVNKTPNSSPLGSPSSSPFGSPSSSSPSSPSSSPSFDWSALVKANIRPSSLVSLISYILCSSSICPYSPELRSECEWYSDPELGHACSILYLQLISLPGSNSYQIFQPWIWQQVLSIIKELSVHVLESQKASNSRENLNEETAENNNEEMIKKNSLYWFSSLVHQLKKTLLLTSLQDHSESFLSTIELLTEITFSPFWEYIEPSEEIPVNPLKVVYKALLACFKLNHLTHNLFHWSWDPKSVSPASSPSSSPNASNSSSPPSSSYRHSASSPSALFTTTLKSLLPHLSLTKVAVQSNVTNTLKQKAISSIRSHAFSFIRDLSVKISSAENSYLSSPTAIRRRARFAGSPPSTPSTPSTPSSSSSSYALQQQPSTPTTDQSESSVASRVMQSHYASHYWPALLALTYHLSVGVVDKADARASLSELIVNILSIRPAMVAKFITFLSKYSRNQKIAYRVFSVDLGAKLFEVLTQESPTKADSETGKALMEIVVGRASDRAPSVRAKSLSALITLLSNPSIAVKVLSWANDLSPTLYSPGGSITSALSATSLVSRGFRPGESLLSLVRRRLNDAKATVRKPALQLLQSALSLYFTLSPDDEEIGNTPLNRGEDFELSFGNDLKAIAARACDTHVGVRKAALVGLTSIIELATLAPEQFAISSLLYRQAKSLWVQTLLPLVFDPETSIVNSVLDIFTTHFLAPLLSESIDEPTNTWELYRYIDSETEPCVRKILMTMYSSGLFQKKKISLPHLISIAQSRLRSDLSHAGAWLLLDLLTAIDADVAANQLSSSWLISLHSKSNSASASYFVRLISILSRAAIEPSSKTAVAIISDLKSKVSSLEYSTDKIPSALRLLAHLMPNELWSNYTTSALSSFQLRLSNYVSSFVAPTSAPSMTSTTTYFSHEAVIRLVFTIGEIVLMAESSLSTFSSTIIRLSQVITTLISPDFPLFDPENVRKASKSQKESSSSNTVDTPSSVNASRGSNTPSASPSSAGSSSTIWFSFEQLDILRAFGFLSLGKLCLQDESLAKQTMPVFARELSSCPSASVRNNIVVILSDLARKWTTLVDLYLAPLSTCLRDSNAVVRKTTMTLLTQLLSQDYIKWKGPLFYRFLFSFIDPVPSNRSFGELCLNNVLAKKSAYAFTAKRGSVSVDPNDPSCLYFPRFIESIFVLNNCQVHHSFNQFKGSSLVASPESTSMFTLIGGDSAFRSRMAIYLKMLSFMNDEQKFNLSGNLITEVLAPIVDGSLPFEPCHNVIIDTLYLLMSPDMKVSSFSAPASATRSNTTVTAGSSSSTEDELFESMSVSQSRLVAEIVKKHTLTNVLPVLISLKLQAERMKSPILKPLLAALKDYASEYKQDAKAVFAEDPQLAKEIAFDLKHNTLKSTFGSRYKLTLDDVLSSNSSVTGIAQLRPSVGRLSHGSSSGSSGSRLTPRRTPPKSTAKATSSIFKSKSTTPSSTRRAVPKPTPSRTGVAPSIMKALQQTPSSTRKTNRLFSTPSSVAKRKDARTSTIEEERLETEEAISLLRNDKDNEKENVRVNEPMKAFNIKPSPALSISFDEPEELLKERSLESQISNKRKPLVEDEATDNIEAQAKLRAEKRRKVLKPEKKKAERLAGSKRGVEEAQDFEDEESIHKEGPVTPPKKMKIIGGDTDHPDMRLTRSARKRLERTSSLTAGSSKRRSRSAVSDKENKIIQPSKKKVVIKKKKKVIK